MAAASMSAKYKTVYVLMLNTSVFVLLNYVITVHSFPAF